MVPHLIVLGLLSIGPNARWDKKKTGREWRNDRVLGITSRRHNSGHSILLPVIHRELDQMRGFHSCGHSRHRGQSHA